MRKEKIITIEKGRDAGKRFKIVEMSAYSIDNWATKVLMMIIGGGATMPDGVSTEDLNGISGLQTVLKYGLKSLCNADYEKTKPLLDDLLKCCYFLPDISGSSVQMTPEAVDTVVEDVTTLLTLKKEAFTIHFDFLAGGDN